MSQARKVRGMASQRIVADWFKANGFPFAESTGAGRAGVDVTGMPGVAIEVKARRGFNLTGWLKQATSERRHGLPVVIVRPDGYGPARIAEWGCVLTLADMSQLLREAGYGTPVSTLDIHTNVDSE